VVWASEHLPLQSQSLPLRVGPVRPVRAGGVPQDRAPRCRRCAAV